MERYITTTYRLHELHISAWGWYVTTEYHLYTNNGNNVIYVYEVFSLEFLVCWRRAWYVPRFRERLSTSLAEVLRQTVFWKRLMSSFFMLFKTCILWRHQRDQSSFVNVSFWLILVHFGVVYCANFLNIVKEKMASPENTWLTSTFRVWDPVTCNCLNLMCSNKLLIDSWCSSSKSFNHTSNQGFKCLSGFVISTNRSECVAKFRFACINDN